MCTAFVSTTLVVPIFAPTAVSDDWLWARTVETLLRDGRLRVPDLAAPTLVFQVIWGAFFAKLFGPTLGVLRLSTVVLVLLSGWALYGLCRELDVSPERSLLGSAIYLFHPLAFGLTFTFMSDPQFVALCVIATFLYVRSIRPESPSQLVMLAGSGVAAMALLVRQQGVLIPVAVMGYLLLSGQLRLDRLSARIACLVAAVPFVTFVGYQLWLNLVNGVPNGQNLDHITKASVSDNLLLLVSMAFVSMMYMGLFLLPLALAGTVRLVRLARSLPWRRALFVVIWVLGLALGLRLFGADDKHMPYAALFLDPTGIGPQDLVGGRNTLIDTGGLMWVTGFSAFAAMVFGLLLARTPRRAWRTRAGLVLALLVGQFVGTLPTSGAKVFADERVLSFDRYLLALLPFAVCLALWSLRGVRLPTVLAWTGTAVFALYSVVGTRDLLVWQTSIWDLAREGNCMGAAKDRFDAGHAWTGYYLSDQTFLPDKVARTPAPRPWWMDQVAPDSDSGYLVSTVSVPGRVNMKRVEYSQWLQKKRTYLYLSRRPDVTPARLDPDRGQSSEVCRSPRGRLRVEKP